LLKNGDVGVLSSSKKVKPSHLIVFDDMIMVCSVNKEGKLEKKNSIPLSGKLVIDNNEGGEHIDKPYIDKPLLRLLHKNGTLCLVFESEVGKKTWTKTLMEVAGEGVEEQAEE